MKKVLLLLSLIVCMSVCFTQTNTTEPLFEINKQLNDASNYLIKYQEYRNTSIFLGTTALFLGGIGSIFMNEYIKQPYINTSINTAKYVSIGFYSVGCGFLISSIIYKFISNNQIYYAGISLSVTQNSIGLSYKF